MPQAYTEATAISSNAALGQAECLTHDEEPLNATTHGLACALGAAGLAVLIMAQPQAAWGDRMACCLFALTLTLTFAASAISHAVQAPREKFLLRAWDQGVIYLLIVATQTPVVWKFAPAAIAGPALAGLWIAGLVGCVSKVVFHHRVDDRFSPWSYFALGCLPAMALCHNLPWVCLNWLALGGTLYTLGVFFLLWDKRVRYFHTVWHLLVIAASGCHFFAIYQFVLSPGQ